MFIWRRKSCIWDLTRDRVSADLCSAEMLVTQVAGGEIKGADTLR